MWTMRICVIHCNQWNSDGRLVCDFGQDLVPVRGIRDHCSADVGDELRQPRSDDDFHLRAQSYQKV